MALQVGPDEGAVRKYAVLAVPDLVEGAADERRTHAAPLEVFIDLGVRQHVVITPVFIAEQAGRRSVNEQLEAALHGVVPDSDVCRWLT